MFLAGSPLEHSWHSCSSPRGISFFWDLGIWGGKGKTRSRLSGSFCNGFGVWKGGDESVRPNLSSPGAPEQDREPAACRRHWPKAIDGE